MKTKVLYFKMGLCMMLLIAAATNCLAVDGEIIPGPPKGNSRNLRNMGIGSRFKKVPTSENLPGTIWAQAKNYVYESIGTNKIYVAIDAATADAEAPDCLKINMNGKLNFEDDQAVKIPVKFMSGPKHHNVRIKPQPVEFKHDGKTVTASVSGYISYNLKAKYAHMGITIAQFAHAKIMIGDKKYNILLSPKSISSSFPQPQKNVKIACVIAPAKGRMMGLNLSVLGEPVMVNDKFYNAKISADGKKISLEKYAGPAGTLKMPNDISMMILVKGTFKITTRMKIPDVIYTITGTKNKNHAIQKRNIEFPAGEYTIVQYMRTLETKGNKPIMLTGSMSRKGKATTLTIKPNQNNILPFNKNFTFKPILKVKGQKFGDSLVTVEGVSADDGLGMQVSARQVAGKIAFYSADGKQVHEGKLEYG